MWHALAAAAALGLNVNLDESLLDDVSIDIEVPMPCNDPRNSSFQLGPALDDINAWGGSAAYCNVSNVTLWRVARVRRQRTPTTLPGAAGKLRRATCPPPYSCLPSPCTMLDMDYQNYDGRFPTTLIGTSSCGAVFGRGNLSGRYTGGIDRNIMPLCGSHPCDAQYYPGDVRVATTVSGGPKFNPFNPMAPLLPVHPRFTQIEVPVWAPIDGEGALAGSHDFHVAGDHANPKEGLFCQNTQYGSSGPETTTGPIYKLYSAEVPAKDVQPTHADLVEQCGDLLLANGTRAGLLLYEPPREASYSFLSYILSHLEHDRGDRPMHWFCYSVPDCEVGTQQDSSWAQLNTTSITRAFTLLRADNLQQARAGTLAGNLPIRRVGHDDLESSFWCTPSINYSVPRDWVSGCADYGYANHIMTCACYRHQLTLEMPDNGPIPPECCQWRRVNYMRYGSNYTFTENHTRAQMGAATNVSHRQATHLQNWPLNESTYGPTVNNFAVLMYPHDTLAPCCPWFVLTDIDACAASPECNASPNPRCLMTATEMKTATGVEQCGSSASTPMLDQPHMLSNLASSPIADLDQQSKNNILYGSDPAVPIDGNDGVPWLQGTSNLRDTLAGALDTRRVRRLIAAHVGDTASEAIVIALTERANETLGMIATGAEDLRTVVLHVPKLSVTDPCAAQAQPQPQVSISLEPVVSGKRAHKALTAVWNVTIHINHGCDEVYQSTCADYGHEITPTTEGVRVHTAAGETPTLPIQAVWQLAVECYADDAINKCNKSWVPQSVLDAAGVALPEFWKRYAATTGVNIQGEGDFSVPGGMSDVEREQAGEYCRWQLSGEPTPSVRQANTEAGVTEKTCMADEGNGYCGADPSKQTLIGSRYATQDPNTVGAFAVVPQVYGSVDWTEQQSWNFGKRTFGWIRPPQPFSLPCVGQCGGLTFTGTRTVQCNYNCPDTAVQPARATQIPAPACCTSAQLLPGDQCTWTKITTRKADGKFPAYEKAVADLFKKKSCAFCNAAINVIDPPCTTLNPCCRQRCSELKKKYQSGASFWSCTGYKQVRDAPDTERLEPLYLNHNERSVWVNRNSSAGASTMIDVDSATAAWERPFNVSPGVPVAFRADKASTHPQGADPQTLLTSEEQLNFPLDFMSYRQIINKWTPSLYWSDSAVSGPYVELSDADMGNSLYACRCTYPGFQAGRALLTAGGIISARVTVNTMREREQPTNNSVPADDIVGARHDSASAMYNNAPLFYKRCCKTGEGTTWQQAPPAMEGANTIQNAALPRPSYQWVNHYDGAPSATRSNAQCGVLAPAATVLPSNSHDHVERLRLVGPRGHSAMPPGPQQFAVTAVKFTGCATPDDATAGPPLLSIRSNNEPADVPGDYAGRAYITDTENMCDCGAATPVYRCHSESPQEAIYLTHARPPPFEGSRTVVCGWAWDDIPNHAPGIGLKMGSYAGPVRVIERDVLASNRPHDVRRFFLNAGAPAPTDLEELITGAFVDRNTPTAFETVYTGTCIRPEYARAHRAELPADRFGSGDNGGLSNAADEAMLHYCDTIDGQLVYCENDKLQYATREELCANSNSHELQIGYVMGPRQAACGNDEDGRFCVYFPGEPAYGSLQSVIDDLRGGGVVYVAPLSWPVMSAVQAGRERFIDKAGHSMSNPANLQPITSLAVEHLQFIAALESRGLVLNALAHVRQYVAETYGGQQCADGEVPGPVPIDNEDLSLSYGCWPAQSLTTHIDGRGAAVYDRVVLAPAVGSVIDVPPASGCTVITAYKSIVIEGTLRVDNSGCGGTQAAVQFVGETAANSSVSVHGNASVFLAASYLGYDPLRGTLSRQLLDVSGARLTATGSYDSGYEAAYARVTGTAANLIECGGQCAVLLLEGGWGDAAHLHWNATVVNVSRLFNRFGHTQIKQVDHRHGGAPVAQMVVAMLLLIIFMGMLISVVAEPVDGDKAV